MDSSVSSFANPAAAAPPGAPLPQQSIFLQWFEHDIPYIAMLLMALVGVVFRLPVTYWGILIPVFAIISGAEGWRHFVTRRERYALVLGVGLSWCALMLAMYLLYNNGVNGVLNANATSLAMMILLALGTFVAGVQTRVWQICAVGATLFLAVPALGWLDQSPLLLVVGTCAIIAIVGLVWWITQRRPARIASAAA